jgi:hypothetical protein
LQIKTKIVSSHTADSKPVKQEVNGTVILPPLVFPVEILDKFRLVTFHKIQHKENTTLNWFKFACSGETGVCTPALGKIKQKQVPELDLRHR